VIEKIPISNSDTFSLINLQLRGQISKQTDYTIGVNNFFDKKVHDPTADFGGPYNTEQIEREIWARLRMKFGL
jgi:outer membrane receptor for ferrienterochelin and colicin